jgi:foldase protein PrsA
MQQTVLMKSKPVSISLILATIVMLPVGWIASCASESDRDAVSVPQNTNPPSGPDSMKNSREAGPSSAPRPSRAATSPQQNAETILVRVNETELKEKDLQQAIIHQAKAMGIPPQEFNAEVREAMKPIGFAQMIKRELLRQEAVKRKIKPPQDKIDFAKKMFGQSLPKGISFEQALKTMGTTSKDFHREISANISISALLAAEEAKMPPVTVESAKKFYEENPLRFANADKVSARHILVSVPINAPVAVVEEKQKKAEEVYAKAKGATDDKFAALAKELSEDAKTANRGGDLGAFSREQKLPGFANAAFSLKSGEVSAPVRTDQGFHIIYSRGIQKMPPRQFAELKDKIIVILENNKKTKMVEKLFETLTQTNKIEYLVPPPSAQPPPGSQMMPSQAGPGQANPFAQPPGEGGHMKLPLPSKDNVLPGIANPHQKPAQPGTLKIGGNQDKALQIKK